MSGSRSQPGPAPLAETELERRRLRADYRMLARMTNSAPAEKGPRRDAYGCSECRSTGRGSSRVLPGRTPRCLDLTRLARPSGVRPCLHADDIMENPDIDRFNATLEAVDSLYGQGARPSFCYVLTF